MFPSSLPLTDASLLVRTSFHSPERWAEVLSALEPEGRIGQVWVLVVDDVAWEGASVHDVKAAMGTRPAEVVFLADEETLGHPDWPFVVISPDVGDESFFRCRAADLLAVSDYLGLGVRNWEELSVTVDDQGMWHDLI